MVMVSNLLFETLSIIVCLYWLDGRKFRITCKMICMVIMNIGILYLCDRVGYNDVFTYLIYLMIAGYARLEFSISFFQVLFRMVAMLVFCAGIQILSALPMLLFNSLTTPEWMNLAVNLLTFLVIAYIYKKVDIQPFVVYVNKDNKKAIILLITISGLIFGYIINAQRNAGMDGMNYLLFFIMAATILILIGIWEKYRLQVKEKEIEIKMHQTYMESYRELVDEIRTRQHEFDNHLQAIINQQYTCRTYEELVHAQSKYVEALVQDNRYNKLAQRGNSVFIGFLYGKLLNLERQGIHVRYIVNIGQLENSIPVYKIIEIVSDLLTNACEALHFPVDAADVVCLYIAELQDEIEIEVKNIGEPVSMDVISQFFKKGYSRKGPGRGFGLYNVKTILSECGGTISCMNENIGQHNWISFRVKIPKPVCARNRF